jgi:hypothetical protein
MKKILLISVLLLSIMLVQCGFSRDEGAYNADISISDIEVSDTEIPVFGKIEIDVFLSGHDSDRSDLDNITLSGRFVTPSGDLKEIAGFYTEEYDLTREKGREILIGKGKPFWRVRFCPEEEGTYRVVLHISKGKTTEQRGPFFFDAVKNEVPGFVKVDKQHGFYMEFDDGTPYFAVGESIAWVKRNNTIREYEYFFDKLKENKCNYSRVWLVEWNMPIEWIETDETSGTVFGIGKYSLDNSWKLDQVFKTAEEKGIYLLLTLDTYGSIMEEKGFWGEGKWHRNPYNSINGGPCETPEDFWTDKKAKELFKKKLKYIISRWGYSPNLLAFELWNEVNAPVEWVKEMSEYIKKEDPYGHLVTTSIGYPFDKKHLYDESKVWELDSIDFTQTHLYGEGGNIKDIAKAVSEKCWEMAERYKKPHLMAEIGLDCRADDAKYDKTGKGVQLHNSLWASVMSKSFGTSMTHWKEYVEKFDLYHQFAAVSNFTETINWTEREWNKVRIQNVTRNKQKSRQYEDMIVECAGDWAEPGGEEITITEKGLVRGKVNQFIHGVSKSDMRYSPVFHVQYPVDGKFILEVDSVAQGAELKVYIDGEKTWEHVFLTGPGEGEWKKSVLNKDHDVYICEYDKKYEIPVSAGAHKIVIENDGIDWIRLKSIILTKYLDKNIPRITVMGLSSGTEAILWVKDKQYSWAVVHEKNSKEPEPINNIRLNILDMEDGRYGIEYWDTQTGNITGRYSAISEKGILPLEIKQLKNDIVCKVFKEEDE